MYIIYIKCGEVPVSFKYKMDSPFVLDGLESEDVPVTKGI